MHVVSLRLRPIIGRNVMDDCPLCSPRCTLCINPDHPGRVIPNRRWHFHTISGLAVGSSTLDVGMLLNTTSRLGAILGWHEGRISILPAAAISLPLTFILNTWRTRLVPGVTVAIIIIPWKMFFPSRVRRIMIYIVRYILHKFSPYSGISVPWSTAAFCLNESTSWYEAQ